MSLQDIASIYKICKDDDFGLLPAAGLAIQWRSIDLRQQLPAGLFLERGRIKEDQKIHSFSSSRSRGGSSSSSSPTVSGKQSVGCGRTLSILLVTAYERLQELAGAKVEEGGSLSEMNNIQSLIKSAEDRIMIDDIQRWMEASENQAAIEAAKADLKAIGVILINAYADSEHILLDALKAESRAMDHHLLKDSSTRDVIKDLSKAEAIVQTLSGMSGQSQSEFDLINVDLLLKQKIESISSTIKSIRRNTENQAGSSSNEDRRAAFERLSKVRAFAVSVTREVLQRCIKNGVENLLDDEHMKRHAKGEPVNNARGKVREAIARWEKEASNASASSAGSADNTKNKNPLVVQEAIVDATRTLKEALQAWRHQEFPGEIEKMEGTAAGYATKIEMFVHLCGIENNRLVKAGALSSEAATTVTHEETQSAVSYLVNYYTNIAAAGGQNPQTGHPVSGPTTDLAVERGTASRRTSSSFGPGAAAASSSSSTSAPSSASSAMVSPSLPSAAPAALTGGAGRSSFSSASASDSTSSTTARPPLPSHAPAAAPSALVGAAARSSFSGSSVPGGLGGSGTGNAENNDSSTTMGATPSMPSSSSASASDSTSSTTARPPLPSHAPAAAPSALVGAAARSSFSGSSVQGSLSGSGMGNAGNNDSSTTMGTTASMPSSGSAFAPSGLSSFGAGNTGGNNASSAMGGATTSMPSSSSTFVPSGLSSFGVGNVGNNASSAMMGTTALRPSSGSAFAPSGLGGSFGAGNNASSAMGGATTSMPSSGSTFVPSGLSSFGAGNTGGNNASSAMGGATPSMPSSGSAFAPSGLGGSSGVGNNASSAMGGATTSMPSSSSTFVPSGLSSFDAGNVGNNASSTMMGTRASMPSSGSTFASSGLSSSSVGNNASSATTWTTTSAASSSSSPAASSSSSSSNPDDMDPFLRRFFADYPTAHRPFFTGLFDSRKASEANSVNTSFNREQSELLNQAHFHREFKTRFRHEFGSY